MRGLRECFIDERGRMIVDERMERWCRVNKVVDEGMERMLEKEKKLRMIQEDD